tara:strand:- start:9659 stop:10852 length:1194 start_codon:yes stop_codon:yes gene_type:complete
VFIVGGMLQFFIGIPNTIMTLGLSALMMINYIIYVVVKKKVVFNKVILWVFFYLLIIFLSGLINKTHIVNLSVYFIFPLLPLSMYLFFFINKKEHYIKQKTIYKLIFHIGLIQLPILLIQRNLFDVLIFFNNSGQRIASVDFLFGSFLLKSDHSLGCFLVFITLSLLFNINNIRRYINYPLMFAIYISITLLLSESNISKAILILVWVVYFVNKVYVGLRSDKLTKKLLIYSILSIIVVVGYNIRNIELITSKVGGTFEKHFTVKKSERFFELGTAKREQIVITAIHSLDTKYFGDGPYSYFDIKTGKFKNTIHFSQIIWTYFDLGIIGLIIVMIFAFYIIKSTVTANNKKVLVSIMLLYYIYMFYTTPFSEIGILSNLFLFFNIRTSNEHNSNTIS